MGPGGEYFDKVQAVKEAIRDATSGGYDGRKTDEIVGPSIRAANESYKNLVDVGIWNPEGAPGQWHIASIGFEAQQQLKINQIQSAVSVQLTVIREETLTYQKLNEFVAALNANDSAKIYVIAAESEAVRELMAAWVGGKSTLEGALPKLKARFLKQWENERANKEILFEQTVAARTLALKSASEAQVKAANLLSSVLGEDTLTLEQRRNFERLFTLVTKLGADLQQAMEAEKGIAVKSSADSTDLDMSGLVNSSAVTMPDPASTLTSSPALVPSQPGTLPSMPVPGEQAVLAPGSPPPSPGLPMMRIDDEPTTELPRTTTFVAGPTRNLTIIPPTA